MNDKTNAQKVFDLSIQAFLSSDPAAMDKAMECIETVFRVAAAPKPEAQGVGEDALIALVAGPYMWHHKMNELQERYAQGFDRCRELTIERIKLYCETRRAMQAALSTPASHDAQQPAVVGDGVLNALRSYEQADADGTFVKVSRQALDEAIAALTPAATPGERTCWDDLRDYGCAFARDGKRIDPADVFLGPDRSVHVAQKEGNGNG